MYHDFENKTKVEVNVSQKKYRCTFKQPEHIKIVKDNILQTLFFLSVRLLAD